MLKIADIHWVNGPEDKGKAGNSREESGSLCVLALDNATSIEGELVDDDQICNTCNGVPAPHWSLVIADGEGCKKSSQDHDEIGNNGNEDVGTRKTGQ